MAPLRRSLPRTPRHCLHDAPSPQDYAGTPARAELPRGARTTTLGEEFVDFTAPRVCEVVLVRRRLVEGLSLALHLTLLALALSLRRQLHLGLAKQLDQLVAAAPVNPATVAP